MNLNDENTRGSIIGTVLLFSAVLAGAVIYFGFVTAVSFGFQYFFGRG